MGAAEFDGCSRSTVNWIWGSGFLWSRHIRQQRKKLIAGRALRGLLDFPVTRDERKAKRREDSAAAILATDLPRNGGAPTDTIDLVDQDPCPPVGHMHGPARS